MNSPESKSYMVRFAATFLISTLLVTAGFSQAGKRPEIRRIDGYAKSLDSFAKRSGRANLIFADVSDFEQTKAKWRRFKNEAELQKFRDATEVYDVANVWRRNGKVGLVVFTLSSPSGDWAKYVSMYFRENGTLAKSEAELRTFYGDIIIRQNFYFDVRGRLLKKTKKYFDLTSGKPKKPDDNYLGAESGFEGEENHYLTTRKLPFGHLLQRR